MSKAERIVQAARERFRYYGIGKTTMQEIAQDAGMAVGTLYLYFSNKDELVVACAEEFVHRHRQEIEAILASPAPADERLRQYILGRFRAAAETRTGSRHAAEITRAVLRVKPDRVQEEGQMMWDTVVKLLRAGAEEGHLHVADPEQDAKVFLYSIAYFFPNALSEPAVMPSEADLCEVLDWFLGVWRRVTVAPSPARKSKHIRPRTKTKNR